MRIRALGSAMATSCQEKLAKLFWGDDLLRGVWFEPLSLL